MRVRKINSLIISIKQHKEMDKIIFAFSYEHGLVRVLAKGVKKITSQRGCHLDILNHVSMEIEETGIGGFGQLYLREVSKIESFKNIRLAPEKFAAGCLVASFLMKILPEGAIQKRLFVLTQKTLSSLNIGDGDYRDVLLSYFSKALRCLGYLPNVLPKNSLRAELWKKLQELDPTFNLTARRTLGTFSKLESKLSS